MKILFTGGGTLGSVTPLLAVAETWREKDPGASFVWIGTRHGPEGEVVRNAGVRFLHLPVARLTRYPSTEWLVLPWRFFLACIIAWLVIGREKPDLVGAAGGFTAVPIVLMAWIRGIPSWIHQPDVEPILTNRICAPFASLVTVAWPATVRSFPKRKTWVIGNPVRASIRLGRKDAAHERFAIDLRIPTVLVVGGGGGATWINRMFAEIAPAIALRANVIHVTGVGKRFPALDQIAGKYHVFEQLNAQEMGHALAAADLIVSRAGMGTLSEIASAGKASVLIPLPSSPQEANAEAFAETGSAIVLYQQTTTVGDLRTAIETVLNDPVKRRQMEERARSRLRTQVPTELISRLSRLVRARKKNQPVSAG